MNTNNSIESSKLLESLKKEAAFYDKTLQNMKQQLMRLEIEELSLNAMIRREQLKLNQLNTESNRDGFIEGEKASPSSKSDCVKSSPSSPNKPIHNQDVATSSNSLQGYEYSQSNSSFVSPSVSGSMVSNRNDERHLELEPLNLNPNYYYDDVFMMFDY